MKRLISTVRQALYPIFTPEVGKSYKNNNGATYVCLEVLDTGDAVMKNEKSGWTCECHSIRMLDNGTIEWDWSTNGKFAKKVKSDYDENSRRQLMKKLIAEVSRDQLLLSEYLGIEPNDIIAEKSDKITLYHDYIDSSTKYTVLDISQYWDIVEDYVANNIEECLEDYDADTLWDIFNLGDYDTTGFIEEAIQQCIDESSEEQLFDLCSQFDMEDRIYNDMEEYNNDVDEDEQYDDIYEYFCSSIYDYIEDLAINMNKYAKNTLRGYTGKTLFRKLQSVLEEFATHIDINEMVYSMVIGLDSDYVIETLIEYYNTETDPEFYSDLINKALSYNPELKEISVVNNEVFIYEVIK